MGYVKKRIRKRKTTDPDEFVSFYQRILDRTRDNLNLVLYSGTAIVLVVFVVFGLMWNRANRDKAAGEALGAAVLNYQSQTFENGTTDAQTVKDVLRQSLKSFRKVSSTYPGTLQGNSATLYASNILVRMGSYNEAAAEIGRASCRERV